MGKKNRFSFQQSATVDPDLDLAPLLSIMVKLIPVLLISSAFVHVMMIETDLPQAVLSTIESNQQNKNPTTEIHITADYIKGFEITIIHSEKNTEKNKDLIHIPTQEHLLDFKSLNEELVKLKTQYSQVFELHLNPSQEVLYQDIIKVMDISRKPLQKNIKFEFINPETNQPEQTEFMFPEVHLSNVLEG
jgi:biopolymer transport protein ExbD